MKNSILLILFVILIAGISVPVHAQTITDHVVINEVDINPTGDDSKLISEWVELFNPTNVDVDISGWQIASTTVLQKTFTIPDGTIISSGSFLTFVHEKIWFTDTSESVELKNQNGLIIDKTREIYDLENDSTTWQRTYDGSSQWKFVSSTPNTSNGQMIIDETSDGVIVTISSDKSSYIFDETAIISGTVSEKLFVEKPTFQSEPIIINISGNNYIQSISLYPDYYLNYDTSLKLSQVLGISEGTYNVVVSYGGIVSETSFSVDSELIQNTEERISSLTIDTNVSEILPGESLSITGLTSKIIPFASVEVNVNDPNGKSIFHGNLFPTDGHFNTQIFLTNVNPVYGNYQIIAEYSDQTAYNNFELISKIDETSSSDLIDSIIILQTDESQYSLTDTIIISGTISNFNKNPSMYAESVRITFEDSTGNSPFFVGNERNESGGARSIELVSNAVIQDNGDFSIPITLYPIAFLIDDYIIKANYGSLNTSTTFSIVSEDLSIDETTTGNPNSSIPGKPSSTDEKFDSVQGRFIPNIKTIIEKVNRISDNLISISTQEKILNEQSVKPRVLSGSMITPSKTSQSTVNLQVTSESGICIIGQNSDCLVSDSTRKPGQIFEVVQVDGINLNVRYSGPDVRLEKFSILPESSDEFLADTNWNVEVLKDNEISRFYYKVTYKTFQ